MKELILLTSILLSLNSYCQDREDYDNSGIDLGMGGVLKIATGSGVGISVRSSIARRLYLRARLDVLFAESRVLTEYNYVEGRPGIIYDVPLKKVIPYFGVDAFVGYFQNALDKSVTHRQLGICGVAGIRTYCLYDRISIGLETGPKLAHRYGQPSEMSSWDNQLINDLFVYLNFQF